MSAAAGLLRRNVSAPHGLFRTQTQRQDHPMNVSEAMTAQDYGTKVVGKTLEEISAEPPSPTH